MAPGKQSRKRGTKPRAKIARTPRPDRRIAGILLELVETKRALTQAQERVGQLERLVDEDPLVPVANRRAFMRELSRMMAFAQRYGVAGSVVYFDLDNLKQINDTHGHAAGDAALVQVARLLVENVRASDVVGRLGGDELGLLLVQADHAAAARKAGELARRIEAEPLAWQGTHVALAVSFGVHAFTGNENAEQVIAAADRAMYRNKPGRA
jgi:diguanylate cyclase (GGDEF)-like protein